MKKTFLILLPAVVLTAGIGWYLWPSRGKPEPLAETAAPMAGPPPTRTMADPVAIFKKAFWREPSAGDKIRRSGRHEWDDGGGITKWSWFLEVDASPELLKYLREDNSFGLVRAKSARLPEDRPSWFTFEPAAFNVLSSPRGNLQLIFSNQGNRLFACDSGRGFQRAATAPASTTNASPAPVSGRLPATSPPNPSP